MKKTLKSADKLKPKCEQKRERELWPGKLKLCSVSRELKSSVWWSGKAGSEFGCRWKEQSSRPREIRKFSAFSRSTGNLIGKFDFK
jgi:hypothetical protein